MRPKKILLVEDDELDIISVERSLKKMDIPYELQTAYNGIEALSLIKKQKGSDGDNHPDIILLDINMPRMNGIEFLKELRKDKSYDNIKIYVMTTSNEEQDRLSSQKLGVAGYVIKPLNFNGNTKKNDSMDNFMQFQMVKILSQ